VLLSEIICFPFGSGLYKVPAPAPTIAMKKTELAFFSLRNHTHFCKFVNLNVNILIHTAPVVNKN
jgi:hypothetical protein